MKASALVGSNEVDTIGVMLNITTFIISIIFIVTYLTAASNMRHKVKSGEYIIQEKLDYEKLTYDEIRAELKSRGRMLAYPVEDNKIYYPQLNQETEEKKEDGE